MNLFNNILSDSFFKPLTSKYKAIYLDCLEIIYDSYRTEYSFGVDKEIIIAGLENYFDNVATLEMVFDDNEAVVTEPRAKATAMVRYLKESGWIDEERSSDFKIKIILHDFAATIFESFIKIVRNEDIEYPGLISQIHATLISEEGYVKPYEYVIKQVARNTEEMLIGLKKLNTSIKRHIEKITSDKSAGEIIEEFFVYHREIGSKAYHRIKTSDNVSNFRPKIVEKIRAIMENDEIFNRAIAEYMGIEQIEDEDAVREEIRAILVGIISAFNRYDDILREIDYKHTKYIKSAVSRAQFLLTNSSSAEGKITRILTYLADDFNADDELNLNDAADDNILQLFNIFSQGFLDNESLYVIPITKTMAEPEEIGADEVLSEEEIERRILEQRIKNEIQFSRKNINKYVCAALENTKIIAASALPLASRRDLIRIIFIFLYAREPNQPYKVVTTEKEMAINEFRFHDFLIERCD